MYYFKKPSNDHRMPNHLHCEYGPAIEFPNGYKSYYINDSRLTEQEFFEWKLNILLR